jgi:hypothetical protein
VGYVEGSNRMVQHRESWADCSTPLINSSYLI